MLIGVVSATLNDGTTGGGTLVLVVANFVGEMLLCKKISIFFPSMRWWQAHLLLFYYFLKNKFKSK
jgi:hypothetical protein